MRWIKIIGPAVVVAAVMLCVGGCYVNVGDWGRVQFERTVELRHPMKPGSTLAASTTSGSIHLTGRDVNEAQVVATIHAQASTEEEAREIAEQVTVRFEEAGDKLFVKADTPHLWGNRSVSVSYEIVAPQRINAECDSASGSVDIADLEGNVRGGSASGSVRAEHIKGSVDLHSASGSVDCQDAKDGDVRLDSTSGQVEASKIEAYSLKMGSASGSVHLGHARAGEIEIHAVSGSVTADGIGCDRLNVTNTSGSISVAFSSSSSVSREFKADVGTASGSVSFAMPPGFSGQVDLSAGSGSVRTDLPVTVTGQVDGHRVTGMVGDGTATLRIRTTSGSIRVR
jgi:hypothetical protein